MIRQSLILLLASGLALGGARAEPSTTTTAVASPATWQVAGSLKTTVRNWAQRSGWPAPQFLTDADWLVDVPGAVPGSIEEALKALAEGFGRAASRPRIEVTVNHVIVISEIGAE